MNFTHDHKPGRGKEDAAQDYPEIAPIPVNGEKRKQLLPGRKSRSDQRAYKNTDNFYNITQNITPISIIIWLI